MMPDIEHYMCDNCHNDVSMGCGSCPNNDRRIEEYHEKKRKDRELDYSAIARNKGGLGFISD